MIRAFLDFSDNVVLMVEKDRAVCYYKSFSYSADLLDNIYSDLVSLSISKACVVLHGKVTAGVQAPLMFDSYGVIESDSDIQVIQHLLVSAGIVDIEFYEFAGLYMTQSAPYSLVVDQTITGINLIVKRPDVFYTQTCTPNSLYDSCRSLYNQYELTSIIDASNLVDQQLLQFFHCNLDLFNPEQLHHLTVFAFVMTNLGDSARIPVPELVPTQTQPQAPPQAPQMQAQASPIPQQASPQMQASPVTPQASSVPQQAPPVTPQMQAPPVTPQMQAPPQMQAQAPPVTPQMQASPIPQQAPPQMQAPQMQAPQMQAPEQAQAKKNRKAKPPKAPKAPEPFSVVKLIKVTIVLAIVGALIFAGAYFAKGFIGNIISEKTNTMAELNAKYLTNEAQLEAYQRAESVQSDKVDNASALNSLASLDLSNTRNSKIAMDSSSVTYSGYFKSSRAAKQFESKMKKSLNVIDSRIDKKNSNYFLTVNATIA